MKLNNYVGTKMVNTKSTDGTISTIRHGFDTSNLGDMNPTGDSPSQIRLVWGKRPQAVGTIDYAFGHINIGSSRHNMTVPTTSTTATFTASYVFVRIDYDQYGDICGLQILSEDNGNFTERLALGVQGIMHDETFLQFRQDTNITIPAYYALLTIEIAANSVQNTILIEGDPTTSNAYRIRLITNTSSTAVGLPCAIYFDGLNDLNVITAFESRINEISIQAAVDATETVLKKKFVSR